MNYLKLHIAFPNFVRYTQEVINRRYTQINADIGASPSCRVDVPQSNKNRYITLLSFVYALLTLFASPVFAQNQAMRIIVNSNEDGEIKADNLLTLREAIALINGTLSLDRLSELEKAQISNTNNSEFSRIEFNLPSDRTTIKLLNELPHLSTPGLIIDGTTQPGYDRTAKTQMDVGVPVVAIAPAVGVEILRGLTIVADNITIRGLSLAGFTAKHLDTELTPPADIFIAHRLPPSAPKNQLARNNSFPFYSGNIQPKNVLIENNWLGIIPKREFSTKNSAFGISVFNSSGTTIVHNLIGNHDGSGIITSVRAENLQVRENMIIGNGIAGMPDAIRLEGIINNTVVNSNLICGNDGSAIFLFKPEGSVQIRNNEIKLNGRRLRRAAIYLMGSQHQIIDNQISNQNGPGVVVSSFPKSDRNIIKGNLFSKLDGMSIDLNTQLNVGVEDFQRGDGPNPQRNSYYRRLETGNAAINAPQFLSNEFYIIDGKVNLDGIADVGSDIEIYRSQSQSTDIYAPLSIPLTTVKTDDRGKFSVTLTNLQPGDKISAIATDSQYGTSEPAVNVAIRSLNNNQNSQATQPLVETPQCPTNPADN